MGSPLWRAVRVALYRWRTQALAITSGGPARIGDDGAWHHDLSASTIFPRALAVSNSRSHDAAISTKHLS